MGHFAEPLGPGLWQVDGAPSRPGDGQQSSAVTRFVSPGSAPKLGRNRLSAIALEMCRISDGPRGALAQPVPASVALLRHRSPRVALPRAPGTGQQGLPGRVASPCLHQQDGVGFVSTPGSFLSCRKVPEVPPTLRPPPPHTPGRSGCP